MPIESNEFQYEINKLQDTTTWIEKETLVIEDSDLELKNKIAELKKEARGRYNEELETTEKLYEITHKNLSKLMESKEQPYFARIDFREYKREEESYYIGKFGLGDSKTGDEIVIDWRAPIADLYYSGTQGEAYYQSPVGVINGQLSLKRKFLIKSEELKDAFDEGINEIILKSGVESGEGSALIDEFLRINLEESVSNKLKDVVATIQKEQNNIIRANKNSAIIVQGSAGSGKTTVALHRLAYLLYKYKNKLSGDDILVIAPNKLFLDYISELLPNLGVDKVKQKTFEETAIEILNLKGKIYTKDKKLACILENADKDELKYVVNSSKLKGSMPFKVMMDRYIKILEREDLNIDDIKVENYLLFEVSEIKRLYSKDLVNYPLNKRKTEIKRYFTLKINEKILNIIDKIDFSYEYQIARIKKTMEDGPERRKKLIEIYEERDKRKEEIRIKSKEAFDEYFDNWQQVDTKELYYEFFSNRETFGEITSGKIPDSLYAFMLNELENNMKNGIIDSDDLTSMLYLKFMIDGVPDKYKYQHIVIDEAQDYSLFQLIAIKFMAYQNSFTIVGDIGQGIYYYKGIEDWKKVIEEVFQGEGEYTPLTQSYRSTVEIIEFANVVLKKQKNALQPALPVLRHGKAPQVIEYNSDKEFSSYLDEIVKEVEGIGKRSVAIIGRTYEECKKIKDVLKKNSKYSWDLVKDTDKTLKLEKIIIPSYMTKGLEFDCSVIYNCNDINYTENELDKKILYVALTRSLHLQYVFYNGNLSNLVKASENM